MNWIKRFFNLDITNWWEKPEVVKPDPILDSMEENGYAYDSGNDWWERTWTTNEGKESIKEVYRKLESGKWNKLMIGYGDHIFYEESVGTVDE